MGAMRKALGPVVMMAMLGAIACSGGNGDGSSGAPADGTDSGAQADFGFGGDDSGAPSLGDSAAASDSDPTDSKPACSPSAGTDDPDDDFKDTNCDGIDGDVSHAVFVAPSGSDDPSTPGTMSAPLKTIGAGIAKGRTLGKDVYVCNASYPEQLTVTDGIRVFGGYDCKAGWKRTLERAIVAPTKGVPLTVKDAMSAVKFDRFDVRAADGTAPGESSIAVLLSNAKDVTISNSKIRAGTGANGETAAVPAAFMTAATAGADGFTYGPMHCTNISPSTDCRAHNTGRVTLAIPASCEGPGGIGGDGGNGGPTAYARAATRGGAGSPSLLGGAAPTSGGGLPGKPGLSGGNGFNATDGFGGLNVAGYAAINSGTQGGTGGTGGGGSGGWGAPGAAIYSKDFSTEFYNGGSGGQGGYGGCGGAGGKGGGGGGASIGIVSYRSGLTLTKSTVDTANGGRGGDGAAGADGQDGGAAGHGTVSTDPRTPPAGQGFDGGPGGKGGKGGNGGAGGGGPSVGIAWFEIAPKKDAVTINVGAPGMGGIGAGGMPAANGINGTDGVYEWTPPSDGG